MDSMKGQLMKMVKARAYGTPLLINIQVPFTPLTSLFCTPKSYSFTFSVGVFFTCTVLDY